MGEKVYIGRPECTPLPFGKHKGVELGQILADDPTYLDWLNGQSWTNGDIKKDVADMCRKYAAEIDRAIAGKRGSR